MAFRLLPLLLLIVPLIEIATFVLVGQTIGLWPTLLGVVIMALIGGAVLRWQGLAVLGRMREAIGRGQLPGREVADAMLIGLAGLLLLLPGYFSDLIGLALLVPAVRGLIYRAVARRVSVVVPPLNNPRGGGKRLDGAIDLDTDQWREG